MRSKIEDYAMIGDCHTAALVARNGSIDWLVSAFRFRRLLCGAVGHEAAGKPKPNNFSNGC